MSLPFSQACENNKQPILSVLTSAFAKSSAVLEVGSGTGQHATYFAEQLPHLVWQPSDQGEYLPAVTARIQQQPVANLRPPLEFNVFDAAPQGSFDALFTANTCHIMPKLAVEALFKHLEQSLVNVSKLCIYGPFNNNGDYTSDSNAAFDQSLKQQDPSMGLRDQQWIVSLAKECGFRLVADHKMPANNQLLEFER
ncbi:DUF938 domain-containing protein [Idiomarina seosinensis]|uniref:Methylase n=1 Tax=Idiomarina seosinensis TaxID=281739 RepID=A0A432ZJD5_9GAMM|nr:DUF938 domain-containing protein [Idiomarina seosinensis]RUO78145.1 methylase [Idiomarina seosinensis]